MARRIALSLLVLAALAAQGCSSEPSAGAAGALRDVTLRMEVTAPDGTRSTARLTCRGTTARARGYLRNRPQAACRTARRNAGFLASLPARDRICTDVYGGPETARIRGTIGARAIDRRFSRRDGCEIADWKRAGNLLPPSRYVP